MVAGRATLDPTGNWAGFDQDNDRIDTWNLEQNRDHNKVNEIDVKGVKA